MHYYNPLRQIDRFEKSNRLTNRIIVKALQSNRGDIIRAMNDANLQKMIESVFNAVHNILAVETRRAYEYNCDKYGKEEGYVINDPAAGFKLIPDVEIEKEVTAYFETNGKLRRRKVKVEPFIVLQGIDESLECLMQKMEMGVRGMRYNPYNLADQLEKADILANEEIMAMLKNGLGDVIRANSYAELKQMWKEIFSFRYHVIVASSEAAFEQSCKDYVPELHGIENDPRKDFKIRTEFEIEQEINAYFEEQGMLN